MALISDVSFLLQGFDTRLETLFKIVFQAQEHFSHCTEEKVDIMITIKCGIIYVCIYRLIPEKNVGTAQIC
jgi:hypothetical protein